jgi:hypothetical protein
MRKEVRLPIAAFVAARDAETERPVESPAEQWSPTAADPFYRPLDRPLTLGSDAMEHLRRGDRRER